MEFWRTFAVQVALFLSAIDLIATYFYVKTYKKWQPNKPYKLIERNPLLRFLWNHTGLILGTIIGAVIMLTLQYIIAKGAHWIVVVLLLAFLIFAIFNHFNNITILHKLIEQYPLGHLPQETFGEVVGNNPSS